MKPDMRKTALAALAIVLGSTSACLMNNADTMPGTSTFVHGSPGGAEIGRWEGDVTVLAVDDGWALVRMSGWVPKDSVGVADADGQRVQGSPSAGIWATGVRVAEDFFGYAQVTGRFVNSTVQDYEFLFIELVYVDSLGKVIDTRHIVVDGLPSGESRAFSQDSVLEATDVAGIEFQM